LGGPWKEAVLAYFEVNKQHFEVHKKHFKVHKQILRYTNNLLRHTNNIFPERKKKTITRATGLRFEPKPARTYN